MEGVGEEGTKAKGKKKGGKKVGSGTVRIHMMTSEGC